MGQVQTIFHESDNGLTIQRVQDIEPILKETHDRRVIGATGSKEFRHAASIPYVVVEQYCKAQNITFEEFSTGQKHARALLNDPALRAFRVWEGRA